MRAKFINEIKQDKSSGLSAIGIGKEATRKTIIKWLDDHMIKFYTINEDLSIDTFESIDLSLYEMDELPEFIQFGKVRGSFSISECNLKRLRGCPKEVTEAFRCGMGNNLNNLEGGPSIVGAAYSCSHNSLTSLKGAPEIIHGVFQCNNNNLTSLEYGPKIVDMSYICNSNKLTTLLGVPTILTSLVAFNNNLTNLKYLPKKISRKLDIRDNNIVISPELEEHIEKKLRLQMVSYGMFQHT